MLYGYLRVSTEKQDIDNQKYELLNYAHDNKLGHIELITETVSGTVSWKDRNLSGLIDKIKKGDILLTSELSRLGRSLLEIFELLAVVLRKGAEIHVVKGNHILKDDLHSKVITFAFSLASELERELLSQRTKEALAKKRSEGIRLGRPKGHFSSRLDKNLADIIDMRGKGVSLTSLARIYDISATAMRYYCNSRKI
jgi:DNA invertase Pin-like site-specific DNA recombinase